MSLHAFQEAENKYGLCYTNYVGDEDSSINPSLIASVPGWGMPLENWSVLIIVSNATGLDLKS